MDSKDLAALALCLAAPPKIAIDHLGMTSTGCPTLLRLVAGGAKIKATGFGRVR